MEMMQAVNGAFKILFHICFFLLFYISLKKCFLKEKEGSVGLFFLSIITNPFLVFYVATAITIVAGVIYIIATKTNELMSVTADSFANLTDDVTFISSVILISSLVSIAVILLISIPVARSLKAHNTSLVTFVYLMFSVLTVLYTDHSSSLRTGTGRELEVLFGFSNISYVAVLLLLYFFIMKALARLSDRKRSINPKLFLIPPVVFMIAYGVFDYYTFRFCSPDANAVAQICSFVILLLFIWAFYTIIVNIRSTDEAVHTREQIKTLSVEVMEALAHTIDAKDEYTRGHSVRVARYSRMLAERLNLSPEDCENVYYMALLHDIGKIGVPNSIINSPQKLTDDEYAVIKTHPVVGYDILAEIKSRPDLSIGAKWHHERYDGKGYPDGKVGEDIPYFARIIAVADSYDAMTSNRSYRKYMSQDKVRSEIEGNSGTQFDPAIAKCMISIIDNDVNFELHE